MAVCKNACMTLPISMLVALVLVWPARAEAGDAGIAKSPLNTLIFEELNEEPTPEHMLSDIWHALSEKGSVTVHMHFATNGTSILPESYAELDAIQALLQEKTQLCLRVEGHTDSTGKAAYNLELSRKRAVSVCQALVARGVEPERLQAVGMGQTQPIADNGSPEGRARNRRVELIKITCP